MNLEEIVWGVSVKTRHPHRASKHHGEERDWYKTQRRSR